MKPKLSEIYWPLRVAYGQIFAYPFKEHLIRRFTDLNRPELDPRPSYQVQLVVNRNEPLNAADREAIEALYREARSSLGRQLMAMLAQRGK